MSVTQPYAFNERGNVESIKGTKPYELFLKLSNGAKLNREEKDYLFHALQQNSGKSNYMIYGVIIPFGQFMKTYIVKYSYESNNWREIKAFDKMCIRNSYYTNSQIVEIRELN
jgi:hypothetical protein